MDLQCMFRDAHCVHTRYSMGLVRGRTPLSSHSFAAAGGWVSAYAHIVTAVIGSGVLSLAWSMSWLGGSLWRHSFM